jgi:hypothetical protein
MKIPLLRWPKSICWMAIPPAVIAFLYVAVANLALSSGAIASLVSTHPEKLLLRYAHTRTFWPGHVHLTGFDLRGREPKLEWALHIDTVDVDLSLLALLRHRFHVAKVTATGVTFRLRFRLEADALNDDRVARIPPIEGFDAVPILGVPPDMNKPGGKPWTLDIQGIDARAVREVWIDAYRVSGVLGARGGFTLGEGRLNLAGATADIQKVALTTGDDAIASEVTGHVDAQIETVDLAVVKGPSVLRYLTMHSTLEGRMGSIRFIRHFVRDDAIELSGGEGTFQSNVRVVRGVLAKNTTSRIEIEPARVAFGGRSVEARVRVESAADDADGANDSAWSVVNIGLSDLALTDAKAKGPAVTCKALAASAHAGPIDLAEPESVTKDFGYAWETARLDIRDLHALDATLPRDSPFHIENGSATVKAHGRGSLLGASAEISVESKIAMDVWGAHVLSGVRGNVPLEVNFVERSLDMAGTELTLTDPTLAGWWSRVKLGTANVRFEPPSLSLALTTTARDGRPFLDLYASTRGASPVAEVGRGVARDLMIESMTANLHGVVRLAVTKDALDLGRLDVQGAASRLRGVLKKRGERLNGGLLIEAGPTTLGISFEGGKTSIVWVDAAEWFAMKVAPAGR